MLALVVLLAVQVVAGSGDQPLRRCKINNRIYNGEDAGEHEFPGVVSLQVFKYDVGYELYCGGSLVSDSWVLTAGHCFEDTYFDYFRQQLTYVAAGSRDAQSGVRRRVATFILHAEYYHSESLIKNDIALAKVDQPFDTTGPHIQPVSLPAPGQDLSSKEVTIVGWGATSITEDDVYSDVLQKVKITLQESTHCDTLQQVREGKIICYEANEATQCVGDSGSPVFEDGLVVGVVSAGIEDTVALSVSTRVAAYRTWIREMIGV